DVRAAVKEYNAEAAPPLAKASQPVLALDAARELRRAAERFQLSVQSLMPHVKDLSEADTEAGAYVVVQTVHAVIEILEEAGHIKPPVRRGVLGSTPDRSELQPVTLEDHKILMQRALDAGSVAWGVLANVVDAAVLAEGLSAAERVQWADLAREGAASLEAFGDAIDPPALRAAS
ncbi:MAG: hypothetical protein Q8N53_12895, partial [Longimicrobiales bacterium]|nr:hypothetical protein [Longimicrobiales bacterium]